MKKTIPQFYGPLGLTPQIISQLGGFKVQGKDTAAAARLLQDALAVQEAGAFALVLEAMPQQLAQLIRQIGHSYHWHRRRATLRWSGTGDTRPVRSV